MKNIILIIGSLILFQISKSQSKLGNQWIVGLYGYPIDFNTSQVIHDTTNFSPILEYHLGHSNICDSNGYLLLCSDGMHVSNNTGAILDGGDTLASPFYYSFSAFSSTYSQSSIFLPMENRKYYLVTPTANDTMVNNNWLAGTNGNFNLLNYHVIDMNANGGAGKVIKRMQPLLENRKMDKTQMMACKHANGKDWWLLKRAGILGGDSNMIYTFLFTQDSVYNYGMQSIPFPKSDAFWQDFPGQMKFNQAGTQMATLANNQRHEFYLADFDRCTGKLSNYKKIKIPISGGDSSSNGLAFSPNGRFIYITQFTNIYQYDLQELNPSNAWFYVHGIDTTASEFAGYTNIDLAPNSKMYIGHFHGTSRQMSVIDNPDLAWGSCNFCRKCLRSEAVYGYFGTAPNMPNYDLGALTPCWPLGIKEEIDSNLPSFSIYPNPSNGQFYVEYDSPYQGFATLELMSSLGQVIYSTKITTNQKNHLVVEGLAAGIYFVKIGGFVKKLVIE